MRMYPSFFSRTSSSENAQPIPSLPETPEHAPPHGLPNLGNRTLRVLLSGVCLAWIFWAGAGYVRVTAADSAPTNKASSTTPQPTPAQQFVLAVQQWAVLLEPAKGQPAAVSAELDLLEAKGVPKSWIGQRVRGSIQLPDRWRVEAEIGGEIIQAGRLAQELWIWRPSNQFGVRGLPGLPRFAREPDLLDETQLKPMRLPIRRDYIPMLPLLFTITNSAEMEVNGRMCHPFRIQPLASARKMFEIEDFEMDLWLDISTMRPVQVEYRSLEDGFSGRVLIRNLTVSESLSTADWQLKPEVAARAEKVALSHLDRFLPAAMDVMFSHSAPLPPLTGERRVVREHGKGRLELHDHTRVLFLTGSPEEMGEQHGVLLRNEIQDLVNRVLYGVGVGSSFEKGRWFFGEIERCQARIEPFIPQRYLTEMDALARAARLPVSEVRLANFFPELFHCSGFALFGQATEGGQMYHGRVLDYLRGVGLEQNAVVIVHQPDAGHAWVNVSYAGFVGSVTAMNEHQLSIGEMGGRGEGNWDGVPMSQLMRMVMEQCVDLDEAIALMRRTPRTCEYYYVLADGKTRRAVGIAATPEKFELVWPGQTHPLLPDAFPDTVLLSAGDRYKELVSRVDSGYGRFDEVSARQLMSRPVAMNSNIQSVLFAPETLDLWVAHADSKNVASAARYTHYNLRQLLDRGIRSDITVELLTSE